MQKSIHSELKDNDDYVLKLKFTEILNALTNIAISENAHKLK